MINDEIRLRTASVLLACGLPGLLCAQRPAMFLPASMSALTVAAVVVQSEQCTTTPGSEEVAFRGTTARASPGASQGEMSRNGKHAQPASKPCVVCGREITWRKKWEQTWDEVRYCSDGCRKRGRSPVAAGEDAALEAAILQLLSERGAGKTICPSEAARRVGGDTDRTQWEPLMEPARAAARRLHAAGKLVVTQGGHPVDPSHAKGPIRLKRV